MLTQVSGFNVRWCGTHTRFDVDLVEVEDLPECAICLCGIDKVNCCTTKCGHSFCLACFIQHSNGDPGVKCPLCRQVDGDIVVSSPAEVEDLPECAICLCGIVKVNCCTTKCGHSFCLACFIKHSRGDPGVKCPLCRQAISNEQKLGDIDFANTPGWRQINGDWCYVGTLHWG
jgi:hypothetical protein